MEELLSYFINSETPFALLFIVLFLYVIKSNKERERRTDELINVQMREIKSELSLLVTLWKTIIETEVKTRYNKEEK